MRKMLMLFASLLIVSSVFAEDYNPGADFHVDAAWNFNGDANFSDLPLLVVIAFLLEWILTATVFSRFYLLSMRL